MADARQNRGLDLIALGNPLAERRQQSIDALTREGRDRQRGSRKFPPARDKVDLVCDKDRVRPGPSRRAARLCRAAGVEDKEPDLDFFGTPQSAPLPFLLDHVIAVAQPGCVGEHNRVASKVDRDLYDVPRGAGDRRGNGCLAMCYLVEKTRFSDVWRTDDRDRDAVSQPFSSASVSEVAVDLVNQQFCITAGTILNFRRQILVGKVDCGLEMGESARQALAPAAVETAEGAVELTERLAPLCLGFGRREIGDRLGLQQIELAVVKGPAGEFAGFGEPQPKATQHLHDRGEYGATAVHMKFSDILPRRAVRPGEPQHEPVVEPLSGLGVEQTSSSRYARRRQLAGKQGGCPPGFRTADTDDGDGGASGRRRRGEDRVRRRRRKPQCAGGF